MQPGKRYEYNLYINDQKLKLPFKMEFQTQVLWQWRHDPPDFKMALASCFYVNDPPYDRPGKPYGGEFEIIDLIHQKDPDFMLWMGDNIYLREADWNTRSGIFYRYTDYRKQDFLQRLLASIHHYAIWDDHDFGPNNSNSSFIHKDLTLEAFKLFWANPSYGINGMPGITTSFQWADVDFFLLDNRYYRSANNRQTGKKQILGEQQIQWLINALKSSRASFKVIAVGGQILSPLAIHENYATFADERDYLLDLLEAEEIEGIIFFSGDRHHSELTKLDRDHSYPLYDLTISPLTAGINSRAQNEENTFRVNGTLVAERNFAAISVNGPLNDRKMLIEVFNSKNEKKWFYEIFSKDLK